MQDPWLGADEHTGGRAVAIADVPLEDDVVRPMVEELEELDVDEDEEDEDVVLPTVEDVEELEELEDVVRPTVLLVEEDDEEDDDDVVFAIVDDDELSSAISGASAHGSFTHARASSMM